MKSMMSRGAMPLLAAGLVISGSAWATNGYFTHGVGTESKGMAGTGVGATSATGPIIAASNPALSVFAGDSWEVGLGFFSPMRSYKATSSLVNGQFGAFTIGEASIDSSSEFFPIPYVAKKWNMGEQNALSLVFYGRGGMNTDWDSPKASATSQACDPTGQSVVTGPGPYCSGHSGVDLAQAFLMLSYAGRASDNFAWGIGPVFAVQAFEAKGIAAFAPYTRTFAECYTLQPPGGCNPMPSSLTDNGHEFSTGYGAAAGIWFGITDSISAGLSYQSKMSMSEFDDYSDLFAEEGGFDIPSSIKFGVSFRGSNNATLNIDVEHTQYSEVDSVGNPMANIAGCPTAGLGGTDFESCLGGKNGAGFGWEDMTTFKLGVELAASETTTWRFGYSFGKQPVQAADAVFNILAPGVMESHFTVGMTRRRSNGGAWSASLMYAPTKTVKGMNMFDPTQDIELEMKQLELELSYQF